MRNHTGSSNAAYSLEETFRMKELFLNQNFQLRRLLSFLNWMSIKIPQEIWRQISEPNTWIGREFWYRSWRRIPCNQSIDLESFWKDRDLKDVWLQLLSRLEGLQWIPNSIDLRFAPKDSIEFRVFSECLEEQKTKRQSDSVLLQNKHSLCGKAKNIPVESLKRRI